MAGMGMGLGALPMNPALVAAALNQASWGLIGNLGGGGAPGAAPAAGPGQQVQCPDIFLVAQYFYGSDHFRVRPSTEVSPPPPPSPPR